MDIVERRHEKERDRIYSDTNKEWLKSQISQSSESMSGSIRAVELLKSVDYYRHAKVNVQAQQLGSHHIGSPKTFEDIVDMVRKAERWEREGGDDGDDADSVTVDDGDESNNGGDGDDKNNKHRGKQTLKQQLHKLFTHFYFPGEEGYLDEDQEGQSKITSELSSIVEKVHKQQLCKGQPKESGVGHVEDELKPRKMTMMRKKKSKKKSDINMYRWDVIGPVQSSSTCMYKYMCICMFVCVCLIVFVFFLHPHTQSLFSWKRP